jgi:hypothetical protein
MLQSGTDTTLLTSRFGIWQLLYHSAGTIIRVKQEEEKKKRLAGMGHSRQALHNRADNDDAPPFSAER